MKRITTVLCCFAFMVSGIMLALKEFSLPNNQTASASPPLQLIMPGKLPLDLQLDLEKRTKTDTIIIHDSVQVEKPKYVRVPKLKHTTDTLYEAMPIPGLIPCMPVNNKISGDREEYTPDILQRPKRSSISLTVDGQVVYSSETDIHSAESKW